MKQVGHEADFRRINSRLWALKSAALVGGLALGAPIAAATSFRFTFMLGALTNIAALLVAFTMHEPMHAREHSRETYFRTLAAGLHDAWRQPPLRYIIAYSGIISAGTFGPIIIFQQPWLVDHGISIANVGAWQAPARAAGIFSALATGWLLTRIGERGAFAALPVVLVLCNFALAGVDHAWIAVAFLGMGFVSGLQDPILASYINHRIDSAHRATVLSVQSVMSSIILAVIEPIAGLIADTFGLQAVFLMFACSTLVFGGAMFLLWDRADRHAAPSSSTKKRSSKRAPSRNGSPLPSWGRGRGLGPAGCGDAV
jgi:predicted MFS family arabinose efflux permease